jgi:hypothetical protein
LLTATPQAEWLSSSPVSFVHCAINTSPSRPNLPSSSNTTMSSPDSKTANSYLVERLGTVSVKSSQALIESGMQASTPVQLKNSK